MIVLEIYPQHIDTPMVVIYERIEEWTKSAAAEKIQRINQLDGRSLDQDMGVLVGGGSPDTWRGFGDSCMHMFFDLF